VRVDPGPDRHDLILIGPPYLPVLPLWWLARQDTDNNFPMNVVVWDSMELACIDLRYVVVSRGYGSTRGESLVSLRRDQRLDLHTRPLDPASADSAEYLIHLNTRQYTFRIELSSPPPEVDTVSLYIGGITLDGRPVAVPRLSLERKGKLWYQAIEME